MNPSEAARVLAVAATFDPRLTPPTPEDSLARAQAWSLALLDDMTERDAIGIVVAHYRLRTSTIMPGDVNAAWMRSKEDRVQRVEAIDAARRARQEAVPMPPQVREALRKAIG